MRILTATFLILFISACAAVDIDRKAKGFDEEQYLLHLTECQEGKIVRDIGTPLGYAGLGGIFTVLLGGTGLVYASPLGVLIVSGVGIVAGFSLGLLDSYQERNDAIENCMIEKGYKVY